MSMFFRFDSTFTSAGNISFTFWSRKSSNLQCNPQLGPVLQIRATFCDSLSSNGKTRKEEKTVRGEPRMKF